MLGGLLLQFAGPRALTEAERRLLAAYADQLAMALDNATLFENAENQKTQLEQVFASHRNPSGCSLSPVCTQFIHIEAT